MPAPIAFSSVSRTARGLAREQGQAAVEYAGALVVVAIIIAAVVSLGWGAKLSGPIDHTVRCILADCGPGASSSRAPAVPTATAPPATTPPRVVLTDTQANPCGAGGTPMVGPLAPGQARPCLSTTTGQTCTPEATPPRLPSCVVNSSPAGASPLPTPDSQWALSNDGSRSCPAGYDFHVFHGVPWCANGTLDLSPGKLDESPWETNRSDYEPGSFNLYCGSGGQACTYTTETPWAKANQYYLCYDEGGTDCEAPDLLPVVGTRVPGEDANNPAHGYQVFPGGRTQQLDYNTVLEQAENAVHGIHESQEQKELMEERLEDWAFAQVSSPAWYSANDPAGAPEGDPIDEDPVDGEGE